ncbi:MAG: 30S ribosomal protein S7 [Myxococcales bacterium]|nr:30S ribosomal protein S7 [Myxococcales bacterium]
MPRHGSVPKRPVQRDPKYGDQLVMKFANCLMYDGKKSVAEQLIYSALSKVETRGKDDPIKLFKQALENVRPAVEVKSRRVGGSNYQVPVEIRPERRTALSIRWLIQAARARGEKSMDEKLANEILEASQARGSAVKKREDVHRMAEANKAFAHYRW